MKQYKKYEDVPSKYKWDLEDLLQGQTKEELFNEFVKMFEKTIKFKDKVYTSKENYLKHLKHEDKTTLVFFRLHNYISNSKSTNVVDTEANAFYQKVQIKMMQLSQELGPTNPELFKNEKKVREWLKDPKFAPWKRAIEIQLEEKKRQLPKAIQKFIQDTANGKISAYQVFNILTTSELDFGKTSGKLKTDITATNVRVLRKHADKEVRKSAFQNYQKGFLKHKESLSNLLYQHFKEASTNAKINKFKSTIEAELHEDRFPEETLLKLYGSVKKNKTVFKKYSAWYKKFYKAKFNENMTEFDVLRELVNIKDKYSIEEAQKIIVDITKPLGKEYNDKIKEAIKDKWIDYAMVNNKHTGAYSIGASYGLDKKYILMNFDDSYNSVSTLAHELGHSMHSYFSDKNQTLHDSQYPIFLAEIASIFNEILLKEHFLKQDGISDKEKFAILGKSISTFTSTVITQTMWSNYEYNVYQAVDKGEPVGSYAALSKIYFDNHDEYQNKKSKRRPGDGIAAIYVPHYYASFYVYKYAIGYLCANIFYQKYIDEGEKALKLYIDNFLSAGSRDWPMAILKDAGIDLSDPKVYDLGFEKVAKEIDQWVDLGKKIFKMK